MAKQLYCFHLVSSISLDTAWEELYQQGIELVYGEEEEEFKKIYGYLEQPLKPIPSVLSYELAELPPVDWETQWASHGLDFYEGLVHVDLQQFGSVNKTLLLQPGPGFGDASHPTTQLMLHLMANYVSAKVTVIDIGCGSGILTIAATAMGAKQAYGIDIDPEALKHAQLNASFNNMNCHFYREWPNLPLTTPIVICMNMIASEQKEAWTHLSALHAFPSVCLTSGIRMEERKEYLRQTRAWGWQRKEEREQAGWLSFAFNSL